MESKLQTHCKFEGRIGVETDLVPRCIFWCTGNIRGLSTVELRLTICDLLDLRWRAGFVVDHGLQDVLSDAFIFVAERVTVFTSDHFSLIVLASGVARRIRCIAQRQTRIFESQDLHEGPVNQALADGLRCFLAWDESAVRQQRLVKFKRH